MPNQRLQISAIECAAGFSLCPFDVTELGCYLGMRRVLSQLEQEQEPHAGYCVLLLQAGLEDQRSDSLLLIKWAHARKQYGEQNDGSSKGRPQNAGQN